MNTLSNQHFNKKMSSREIAELCEKSHDNVLKLIRSLITGGIVNNTTPHEYVHQQNNQTYIEFLSDKRDSLVIVARLSPEFTAAVIDRWQELEGNIISMPAIPQSLSQALRLAADQAEQIEQQQARLSVVEPKAQALDAISHSKGSIGIREAGKISGLGQNRFVEWCMGYRGDGRDESTRVNMSARFLYRDLAGALHAYSHRIAQGYVNEKSNLIQDSIGRDRLVPKVRFTSAGMAKIAEIMATETACTITNINEVA